MSKEEASIEEAVIMEVPIPERAQRQLVELDRNMKQAQAMFQLYIQALLDAFGLEGQWGFSPDRKKFVRIGEPEAPPDPPQEE